MPGHGPCRQWRDTGSASAVSRGQLVEHGHLGRAGRRQLGQFHQLRRRHAQAASRLRRRGVAGQRLDLRDALRDRGRRPVEARGHVRLLGRKRRRQLRDRTGRTVLSDPFAGGDAAALGRRRRARQRGPARGQRPASFDHRLHATASLRALQRLVRRHEVARGIRRILRHEHQQPAARDVDLRGRGGARDLPRPRALRRGVESRDHRHRPCVPRHGARHQRLRLSGIAPRGQHHRRVAHGRAAAAQENRGRPRPRAAHERRQRAEDLPRDAEVRSHRCRQRLGHVHHGHVRHALEQRHPESRVRALERRRFRGRAARVEADGGDAACACDPGARGGRGRRRRVAHGHRHVVGSRAGRRPHGSVAEQHDARGRARKRHDPVGTGKRAVRDHDAPDAAQRVSDDRRVLCRRHQDCEPAHRPDAALSSRAGSADARWKG